MTRDEKIAKLKDSNDTAVEDLIEAFIIIDELQAKLSQARQARDIWCSMKEELKAENENLKAQSSMSSMRKRNELS